MADDFKYRTTRANDPLREAADPSRSIDFAGDTDPLAELARLIGQNDPFTEYGRTPPRAPQSRDMPLPDLPLRDLASRDLSSRDLPSRDFPSRDLGARDLGARDLGSRDPSQRGLPTRDSSPRDLLSREMSQREFPPRDTQPRDLPRGYSASPEWAPSLGSSVDPRYEPQSRGQGRESYPAFDEYPSRSPGRDAFAASEDYPSARSAGRDPYASPAAHDDYLARAMAPPAPRGEPGWAPREEPRWAESQNYGDVPAGSAAPEEAYPDEQAHGEVAAGEIAAETEEYYYEDDAPLQPEDEDTYDDAPGISRWGSIATALTLIVCALLGTAGAYAYRSYVHPPAKAPPPIISADQSTPNKVAPPAAEARSGKQISDRFATAAAGNEQLVSRQEEPVALREPGTADAPRVVLPAPVQPAPPPAQPAPVPPVQAAAPPPPPAPAPAPPPPAAATPTATQAPPGGEPKRVRTVTIRPEGDQSGRPVTNTTPPAPRATGSTPPAPRAAAPRSGGPLSLEPNEPRSRTAHAPPPPTSLSSFSASGGYVVQLSSQRSENDAHASFRALQAKFPNELANRQVIIRRADLGSKGVVYRTNVGPFQTAQEAQRFCSNYKAAGGQCIVPTN